MKKYFISLVLMALSITASVQAAENTTLNFAVQSTDIQTNTVALLSSSQQLSKPINITLIDHNKGESIKSFILSTVSKSEEVPLGRYDVFVVQGTEEIILNNNGSGYMAGDTTIVPLYCDPSLVTCQLEDMYYLDIPWRVEPNVNIPVFGIINTPASIWSVSIYDTKHTDDDASDDTLLDQKVFSPSLSITSSDLPYTFEFSVNPSAVTIINGNASIRIVFHVDDIIDYDNDEGPLEVLISTSNLPKLSNWYSGDTHYHSSYTNNEVEFGGTIGNTVGAGKAIGLDWVTITDHSFDLDDPLGETYTEWNNLVSDTNSYSTIDFILIAGEEISCDNAGVGNYNHYLGYDISNRIFSGEVPDGTGSPLPCSDVVQQVNTQGGFGYIAHPFYKEEWGISYRNVWQDYSLDFEGLEVWNGKTDVGTWEELLYDGMNKWVELLLSGRHVFIEGGSDAHGDFSTDFGTVRTVVNAPDLTRNNILSALRNGRSVMTDGPLVVFDVTNETGKKAIIGDTINGSQFSLNMEWKSTPEFGNVNNIYVHRGVIGENETELLTLSFAPNDLEGTRTFSIQDYLPANKESYIRINATTDKGYRVYTNPLWINKSSSGRSSPPDSFGYTFKDSNTIGGPAYDWIEISGTGTEVLPNSDDDVEDNITIGFFFNYYGTNYSQLAIANNGLLFSSGTTWQYRNEPITNSPSVHGFIAPFWDDLITYDSEGAGTIYYQILGTAPNRMFVVEWYDNKHYENSDSGITFEAILYEGTNNILFQYRDVDFGNVSGAVPGDDPPYNNGGSATVGIEAPSGDIGLQYSFNEPVINSGLAILFKFPAFGGTNMYLTKNAPVSIGRGNVMNYTLYFNNFGSVAASNVVLQDTLPPSVEFISASDGGTYDSATRKITWDMGLVASFPSGRGSRTVTVRVPGSVLVGTVILNTASITTSNIEIRYDDNSAVASTTVTEFSLPPDVGISPINGNTGDTPSVYWGTPITFTYYSSCATSVGINIHVDDGGSDITGSMLDTSPDTWTYTTTLYPRHGAAAVTYTISGCSTPSVAFNIYIDPAGYIYDAETGARISGATVWLQRPDGQGGWENVPTGQTPPVAQPDINPLITGADGQYQWDVLEGAYRVHVEAIGYYPADSIVVNVPPPVTDLHVGLTRPDSMPPNTSYALSGNPGSNGWYISDVQMTLTATDNEGGSGVGDTEYSFDGVSWVTYTSPVLITNEGTTTFYYHSIDIAGNVEPIRNQTISIDKTPPMIAGSATIPPNTNGWYNSDVTVHFTASDAISGIDTITPDTTISTEGADQSVNGTATDKAGNSNITTVSGINIDKTKPDITITSPESKDYLHSEGITLSFEANDVLSGNDSITASLDAISVTNGQFIDLKTLTLGQHALTVNATDRAGNSASKSVTFNVNPLPAAIDFRRDALRYRISEKDRKLFTVYIEVPGYDVNAIDVSTVTMSTLKGSVSAQLSPTEVGDDDRDGIPDMMVNFGRQEVMAIVDVGEVNLTINGKIAGAIFEGVGVISVEG